MGYIYSGQRSPVNLSNISDNRYQKQRPSYNYDPSLTPHISGPSMYKILNINGYRRKDSDSSQGYYGGNNFNNKVKRFEDMRHKFEIVNLGDISGNQSVSSNKYKPPLPSKLFLLYIYII